MYFFFPFYTLKFHLPNILHLMKDREKARAHMIKTYRDVMTSAYSLRQYERFFRLLLAKVIGR